MRPGGLHSRPSNEISGPTRVRSASPRSGGKSNRPQRRIESPAMRHAKLAGARRQTARQPAAIDRPCPLRFRQRGVHLGAGRRCSCTRRPTGPWPEPASTTQARRAIQSRELPATAEQPRDAEERGAERGRARAPAARAARRRRCARTPSGSRRAPSALNVSSPIFCIVSLIRKRGNMLPPSADIVRIRIVEKPGQLRRVRASVASTRPKRRGRAGGDHRHHDESGQV